MAKLFVFSGDDTSMRLEDGAGLGKGFELAKILPLMEEHRQSEYLRSLYPLGKCYLWGARATGGNLSVWLDMAADDLLLGYRGNTIFLAARILAKMNAPRLAARVWENDAAEPFSLLCFLAEPYVGKVTIVPQMLRYVEEYCSGFQQLSAEKSACIVSDYGSLENFVRLCLGYDFPFSFRHSD
ncbi:MAG TPA: hypothetical protein PK175_03245 [Syntrophales bacterium]|jgi:hypothetical protein|nr:hypothetical protein [Syntrophales bacterium]HOU76502.1 hypothetical protein [Syntrophales bacterium]HPC32475.1 hypothetical protein [Syntrophales bacterium]HQG33868.1 hypothetical protein [Syntrophales bacterium]HQI35166.1 hypothetical protein [Syntrophales bacterium]